MYMYTLFTRSGVFKNVTVDDAFMDVSGLFLYSSVGKVPRCTYVTHMSRDGGW